MRKNTNDPTPLVHKTLLSMPEVTARIGRDRHTVLKWSKAGTFPRVVKPSGEDGHNFFMRDEIEAWERGEFKNG